MGIYWEVLNQDQATIHLGDAHTSLRKILFASNEPERIVTALATPVKSHAPADIDLSWCGRWAGERVYCLGSPINDEEMGEYTNLEWPKAPRLADWTPIPPRVIWPGYPMDRLWVLRNLSKRQYVRADAIAAKPEYLCGPYVSHGPGLGEVVIIRTLLCNNHVNTRMAYRNGAFTHGVWQGDRLDITPIDQVLTGQDEGTEWKNVSEEVAIEVKAIWKSEYGRNWRTAIEVEE